MYDREKIIEDFSPLIKASIKKYFANYISYEDAYQDGVVKILELLESYKGGGKVSFECYLKYQLKFFYMQKFFKRKKKLKRHILKYISQKMTRQSKFWSLLLMKMQIHKEMLKQMN